MECTWPEDHQYNGTCQKGDEDNVVVDFVISETQRDTGDEFNSGEETLTFRQKREAI